MSILTREEELTEEARKARAQGSAYAEDASELRLASYLSGLTDTERHNIQLIARCRTLIGLAFHTVARIIEKHVQGVELDDGGHEREKPKDDPT